MTYAAFLDRLIDSGLDTLSPTLTHEQVDGCLAGYSACRGKSPAELLDLIYATRQETFDAQAFPLEDPGGYYRAYYREQTITDVCDIVSAALEHWDMPTIVRPTARGRTAASRMLGVRLLGEE